MSLVFDNARGVGLYTMQFGSQISTYEWNGTTWTSRGVTAITGVREFRFAYDTARNVHVGVSGDGGSLRTHQWNEVSSTWVMLSVPFSRGREGFALAYDSNRSRTVLFGGRDPLYVQAETYEFDGVSWQLRSTGGPLPRINAALTYDSARKRVLLFGGESESGQTRSFGDTWEWNGVSWLEAFGVSGPSARRSAGLGYDPVIARGVLVGGYSTSGNAPIGTWEWDGASWTGDTTSVQPTDHGDPVMTYDPVRGKLLFAGLRWYNGWISECWERIPLPNSQPSWTAFGSGCAGTAGIPTLSAATGQLPRIGRVFTTQLGNLPAGPLRLPFGFLGTSKSRWSGISLPFDLGLVGMPGCALFCGADLTFPLTATGGLASWPITIPYDVALVGALAYQQALVLDPAVNLLGATTSNAGELKLGI